MNLRKTLCFLAFFVLVTGLIGAVSAADDADLFAGDASLSVDGDASLSVDGGSSADEASLSAADSLGEYSVIDSASADDGSLSTANSTSASNSTATSNASASAAVKKGTAKTIVNGTSNMKIYYGQSGKFKVKLTDKKGGNIAGKKIRFTLITPSGKKLYYNRTTNKNGNAYLKLTKPSKGVYTVKYSFEADSYYAASSGSRKVIVAKKQSLKLIGKDSRGKVELLSVIGNPYSKYRIAYVVGLHIRENQVHKALYKLMKSKKNMNYAYYVYRITLNKVTGSYSTDRMNGQLLARKYIVPHVKKMKYDLVVDVHSTDGLVYQNTYFIHVPKNTHKKSLKYAYKTINNIKKAEKNSKMKYWSPASQTSPPYIHLPLMKAGIPTFVFETLSSEKKSRTAYRVKLLVNAVDKVFA